MKNFLDLEDEDTNLDSSKVVIVQVPFEGTVSYGRGTGKGPAAIIDASGYVELYDDELKSEPYTVGIHTLRELEPGVNPEEMVNDVKEVCSQLLGKNKFLITLGGEHTVTLGAVKGYKAVYEDFSVLNIDAHCDLRDTYEGTKYSHACVMKRIIEEGCPVVGVGIRSYCKEETDFIETSSDVKIIHAREIAESGNDEWIRQAVSYLNPNVYISVDIDVFDPSVIPGTGTPEPGGLDWYQVTALLREVFEKRNVIGLDIVELAPISGMSGPDFLAAKLAYKAIGYKFEPEL